MPIEKNGIDTTESLFCAACDMTARVTYRYPNRDLMLDCNHMVLADPRESESLEKNKK